METFLAMGDIRNPFFRKNQKLVRSFETNEPCRGCSVVLGSKGGNKRTEEENKLAPLMEWKL